MYLRHGYYCGLAAKHLGDNSYMERWYAVRDRGEVLTEEDYFRESAEIQERLAAAGIIRADEDPFDGDGFMQAVARGIEDGII